jgi:hypothetical protein
MAPTVDILYLKPPVEIDRTPPPLANHVRLISAWESFTLFAYYVSATRLQGVDTGNPQAGITVEGNTAIFEEQPVARFAVPITTGADLALLLIKNLVAFPPQDDQRLAFMKEMSETLNKYLEKSA